MNICGDGDDEMVQGLVHMGGAHHNSTVLYGSVPQFYAILYSSAPQFCTIVHHNPTVLLHSSS